MATSTESTLFKKLTYVPEIQEELNASGSTVIFTKDNVIMASEVSEAQYRELLNNPYIEKLDVLPLKRYGNDNFRYIEETNFDTFINIDNKNI